MTLQHRPGSESRVLDSLMIPFLVVVPNELPDRALKHRLPEEDELIQALAFYASHEPLREGVQIWRAGWQEHGLDAVVLKDLSESLGGLVTRSMMRCVEPLSGLFSKPVKSSAALCMNNSLGHCVEPTMCTRRLAMSMTNSV